MSKNISTGDSPQASPRGTVPKRFPHWNAVRAVVKAHQPQTDTSKIRAYPDYREMIAKEAKNLDAVAIATPNHHHALAALLAMAQGLHVYVEKPMALTIEEVRRMHAMLYRPPKAEPPALER